MTNAMSNQSAWKRIGMWIAGCAAPIILVPVAIVVVNKSGDLFTASTPTTESTPQQLTPEQKVSQTYTQFDAAMGTVYQDLVNARARQYLDEAQRHANDPDPRNQPLGWLYHQLNAKTTALQQLQQTTLEFNAAQTQKTAQLALDVEAIGLAVNAITQSKTGELDTSVDLTPGWKAGQALRDQFGIQVIDRRYPDE